MKYLTLLSIALLISSCCSAKQIVEHSPEVASETEVQTEDIVLVPEVVVEVPKQQNEAPEVMEPKEDASHLPETIIAPSEAFDHSAWNTLLQQYVSNQGKVNYKGLKSKRKTLTNYITALSNTMPQTSWTNEDKLAYWMNAYNAMTVDLILRNYPLKSIKDIDNPWDQRLWKLGEKWYNLDEIEHQILRKMNEPRIHFGIVCASVSCPKLQNVAFTAGKLEMQLTNATKEFLADSNHNTISETNLKLSKIFKWFAQDFKQNGSLIDFLNLYSDIDISDKAKKSFKDYNWDLNE